MAKKTDLQVLEDKYEKSLIDAGRFDVFRLLEKINKKRKKKRDKIISELGFDLIDVDEFEVSEWSPRIPKRKRK